MEYNEYESKYKALAKLVGIPIRIICVVRNPFDVISTSCSTTMKKLRKRLNGKRS